MPKTYQRTLSDLSTDTAPGGSSLRDVLRLLGLPDSVNFSSLDEPDGSQFDAGDDSEQASIFSILAADKALLLLLTSMNDRQKVILLFQVLRDAGYNLNHQDCAATLSVTRERYMVLLKDVKKRSAKILQIPAK